MPPTPTRFTHKIVNDLAWACFSTPLLNTSAVAKALAQAPVGADRGIINTSFSLTPARLQWLQTLDKDPSAALAFVQKRPSSRLGLYFEGLWQFFLSQDPQTTLLAHNLAVREGGRTLGEFDCLYYCHQRDVMVHLELAVKYYLHHGLQQDLNDEPGHKSAHEPGREREQALGYEAKGIDPKNSPISEWRQWLGPACRDRLDLKITTLIDRQVQLSDHSAAKPVLKEIGIDPGVPLQKEVEVKGLLFKKQQSSQIAPIGLHPEQDLCDWLPSTEFKHYCDNNFLIRVLNTMDWLNPHPADEVDKEPWSIFEVIAEIEQSKRPRQILLYPPNSRSWKRVFVTPVGWPLVNQRRSSN